MKKTVALLLAGVLIMGALCSCSDKNGSNDPVSTASDGVEREYSVTITAEYKDGIPTEPVVCEYVDGEDSIEVYYITFGCDVDGITLERVDMTFKTEKILYTHDTIKYGECFKLTTTTPEGCPNTRVIVTCGENEYRYLLCYNGRDGGADLIDDSAFTSIEE